MDLSEIGMGEASIIKPEHLSAVISSSAADYLIVIGDRNMKNDTCEVRDPRARAFRGSEGGATAPRRHNPPTHPPPPPPPQPAGAPRGEAR